MLLNIQLSQKQDDIKICQPMLFFQEQQEKFSQDQFTTKQKQSSPVKASFAISIVIVVKTVVGAGILGLPSVFAQWGWLLPTIFFIVIAYATQQSCILLLQSKKLSGRSNYSTLGKATLDHKIFIFFIYFVFVFNNSGICIAQAQIFGQSIVGVLQSQNVTIGPFYTERWFVSLLLLLLIPIVLLRKIQSLKYLTVVGLFAIISFIVLVFVDLGLTNSQRKFSPSQSFQLFHSNFDFFKAFATTPNVILAFTYQINFFPIYKGMQNPNPVRMQRLSSVGLIICFCIYFTVAIVGYATYGDLLLNSQGSANTDYINVVTQYGTSTAVKLLMNVAFILNSFFTLPIIFFSGRNCLVGIVMLFSKSKKIPNWLFNVLTLGLFLLIVIVAILVNSLGATFNVIGSIASNFIGFIFPGIFYLVINQKREKTRGYYFVVSIILIFISSILLILGLASQYL